MKNTVLNEQKKMLSNILFTIRQIIFFVIEVKSVLKLNMFTNSVSVGVSFRQASRLYQSVKEETGMGVMGSISDVEVAHHCRIVCAVNL